MKVPKHISVLGSPDSLLWEVSDRVRNPSYKKATEIQSVIFDRSKWTVKEAKAWLKEHKKKAPAADTTADYHRFRQAPPGHFQKSTFRTIPLGAKAKGIKAVIAVPAARNPETRHTSFYSRQFFLCCNASLTVLYLIDGQYADEIGEDGVSGGAALADAYSLWSGFEPSSFYSFDLPAYELKKRGESSQINYQSD